MRQSLVYSGMLVVSVSLTACGDSSGDSNGGTGGAGANGSSAIGGNSGTIGAGGRGMTAGNNNSGTTGGTGTTTTGGAGSTAGGSGATGGNATATGGSGAVPVPDTGGPREFDANVPMGWAVVPGYGLKTTTGGGGGEVVTAKSHAEFSTYVGDATPRIVLVQGKISGSNVSVGSNKTILGVGADAALSGFYLDMDGVNNIIVRNLTISGGVDAIGTKKTTHLWIDHMDVSKCGDGLIDITRESDMYLVSWVRFSNHHKTMLLNAGSRHYDDRGKLNGTIHHNFFDGSDTRNPRAGFGKIHVFNDYNLNNGYGIGFHSESLVVAEKNYFENGSNSINQMYNEPGYDPEELGDCLAIDNKFVNASGDESTGKGFTVTDHYMYDFVLDPADDVKTIVMAGAGTRAEYGEIGLMPIPGQGAIGVDESILGWKTGTHSPTSYVVHFGTTTSPPQVATTADTTFDAGALSSGTVYYWRVDQVTASATIPGKLWTFKAK